MSTAIRKKLTPSTSSLRPSCLPNARELTQLMMGQWKRAASASSPVSRRLGSFFEDIESAIHEVEHLNNQDNHRAVGIGRILRRQGRINRKLYQGGLIAAHGLSALNWEDPEIRESLQKAVAHLDQALWLSRQPQGSEIQKRLKRDQEAVNRELCDGLSLLVDTIRNRLGSRRIASHLVETLGHLTWHVNEARHLNGLPRRGPAFLRRCRRNQHGINQYLLIGLKQFQRIIPSL